MITVHRLHGEPFVINAHLIATVEASPDTVITLVNGQKFVVRDSLDDVVEQVIHYRRRLGLGIVPTDQDADAGVLGEM